MDSRVAVERREPRHIFPASHASQGGSDRRAHRAGSPASPASLRQFLIDNTAETVRHGNHMDFVVGDRLLHVATEEDREACGDDCGAVDGESCVSDHGSLIVSRRRVGATARTALPRGPRRKLWRRARSRARCERSWARRTPALSASAAVCTRLIVNARRLSRGAAEGALDRNSIDRRPLGLVTADDVRVAMEDDRTGGGEASAHTRMKVLGDLLLEQRGAADSRRPGEAARGAFGESDRPHQDGHRRARRLDRHARVARGCPERREAAGLAQHRRGENGEVFARKGNAEPGKGGFFEDAHSCCRRDPTTTTMSSHAARPLP